MSTLAELTALTPQERRDLIIQAALDHMEHEDWYWTEDEDYDPIIVGQLEELLAANPDLPPTPTSGVPVFDVGVTLALYWEAERRAEYERSLPLWICDCGTRYKREPWGHGNECFYTVTDDGLLDQPAGALKGKRGIGSIPRDQKFPINNGGCVKCSRAFSATIARQTSPQTSLFFDLS